MPYKIVKRVDDGYPLPCIRQVSDFLAQTANFGKKIYTTDSFCNYVDEKEKWYLKMRAVAISRDVVYELLLTMPCHRKLELNGTYEEFILSEKPLHGLIPWHEDLVPFLYPCLETSEKIGNKNSSYVDIFQYNNFTQVDVVEEIE